MDVGFGDVGVSEGPESRGDKSFIAVGSRERGRREIRDSKKDSSLKV